MITSHIFALTQLRHIHRSRTEEALKRVKNCPGFIGKRKPQTVKSETFIVDAFAEMVKKSHGSIVVVDANKKATGILIGRNILKQLVDEKHDAEKTPFSEVMRADRRIAKADDEILYWL